MGTFELLLLTGALCGVIMVLGGIILLYKGAISLASVSGEEAFTIEYKKELRISTQYPALGIFIIGLVFVAFSVWMGKPKINKLIVKGKTIDVSEPVKVSLQTNSWSHGLSHSGEVFETFYPNIDTIQILVSAPGYDMYRKSVQVSSLRDGLADLGNIKLTQKIVKSQIQPQILVELPRGANIPQISTKYQFGEAK